jgi:hypothetical protein
MRLRKRSRRTGVPALRPIPGDFRRLVEAGLRELDPSLHAGFCEFAEGQAFVADEHAVVANTISFSGTPCRSAAKAVMRALMTRAAFRAAMPLRSDPAEAAVGAVFGTFAVVVAVMRTRSSAMPNSSATTWATLV